MQAPKFRLALATALISSLLISLGSGAPTVEAEASGGDPGATRRVMQSIS